MSVCSSQPLRLGSSKEPGAVLDYRVDWSLYLAGDTITQSDWTIVNPQADSVNIESSSFTANSTTVFLSAGIDGQVDTIENRITTQAGRVDSRVFQILVADL